MMLLLLLTVIHSLGLVNVPSQQSSGQQGGGYDEYNDSDVHYDDVWHHCFLNSW